MSVVTMRELLEAGVHFGHQTRRWNPKMRRYIFGERGGIYIIDLTKTQELLEKAERGFAESAGRQTLREWLGEWASAVGEQMNNEATVRWAPDDRSLTFINQEKGVSNLWLYAVADGKQTKLTDFDEYMVFTYDWSFDGKRLAVTRISVAGDAVLISDVK